jgi:serine phosphatase RsbU (regulator of sigma subunit)
MNQKIQNIMEIIQQSEKLDAEQKNNLLKAVKDADKELEITAFKLERTEKVKKTTAILLEETIEELEQKRKSVESQNRELEIETALEKVRTMAMGMRKPGDMLDVCKTISLQLESLGVKEIRNVQTAIFYEQNGTYMNYEHYAKHKKTFITETTYTNHEIHEEFATKMLKGTGEVFITHIKGNDVKDWIAYQKTTNVFIDKYLETASSLNYYWFSLGPVALGISTYHPLTEEDTNLFKRFLKVFELAYRRYLDIEKAEAQAREAQIELGLERVRARAMAMQNSNELSELVDTVFKELTKLDFSLSWCIINIIDESSLSNTVWAANPNIDKAPDSYHMKFEDYPFHDAMMRGYKERETKFIYVLEGIEKKVYDEYLFKETEFRKVPEEAQAASRAMEKYVCSFTFSNFGGLQTVGEEPLSDENLDILSRFGKVFDLTYTRFNDLEQAEAQAREGQIESALERVRSRTMGMQKSEELKEVIQVVYEQFVKLNIHIEHTGFIMDYKARDDMHIWLADKHEVPSEVTIPYFDSAHWNSFNEAKEKGIDFFANHLSFEEKNKFYQDLFKLIPGVPEETLEYYFSCPGLAISTVLLENVGLYIENFSGIPYSDEENKTLMRFGKVFQQTYTRFLDLQKAEAQAREAQIEAALEKVRSRSLAMHSSEEMQSVANAVYEQLNELGLQMDAVGMSGVIETKKDYDVWIGGSTFSKSLRIPFNDATQVQREYNDIIEKRSELFSRTYSGKIKKEYTNHLLSHGSFPDDLKKLMLESDAFSTSISFAKNSSIQIARYTSQPYSDHENEILIRFAKVFEQAYIRFLDLQKSEAQAREAQIETALEKVRSRTMAMQRSEELSETSFVLFQQFAELGISPNRFFIGIVNEEKGAFNVWITEWGGTMSFQTFKVNIDEPLMWKKAYEAWKIKDKSIVVDINGEDLVKWNEYLRGINFPVSSRRSVSRVVNSCAIFSKGALCITTAEIPSSETIQLLERFASVFDGTYTRFIDLQKAEAQAREAQIEAALERVRSKTMAMHNSNDVGDTVVTLFDEVIKLGLDKSIRCGIGIFEGTEQMETWSATFSTTGEVDLKMGMLNLMVHPVLEAVKKAWKSGKTNYSYEFKGKDVTTYYTALNNESNYPFHVELNTLPDKMFQKCFFFSEGILFAHTENPISEEAAKVLNRFASVFGQTYRRYLDLKKAEAQARESQIEAALERVRSKAMAMHSSEDLSATVNVFFKELKTLGIAPIRCGVGQIDEETRTTSLTTTTSSQQGDSFEVIGKIKQTGHPVLDGIYEHWELQKEYHPVLQGDDIKTYYSVMKPQMAFPDYPEDATQYGNLFYFKEGFVFAWTESKLIEDELQIFRRFTSVLSLTYRRYIDLKEAEARSVEAVRQASLDRVRAEIASMRTTNDLEKITPLIWRELTTLGVPFFRCGVFIIDEPNSVAHAYLSTPLGKSLAALHVKIDNTWLENAVKHWRNGEIYHEVWDRNKFLAWTQTMMEQGFVENKEHFQAGKEAPETLSLQLLPFTQGMLYVGSKLPLSNEEIKIAEKLADDFGVAYSRYEDFQKLEAVNHRKTLELEEARQLQLSMLPKELPKLPNLDIAVYMQTATEVGGDYYDFQVGIDGMLTTVIGDATGHGMKAGTVVTITKSLFNSMAANENILGTFDKISQVIKGMKFRQLAMCLLMMKIRGNRLSISSAAMPPALIYRAKNKSVEELLLKGMPLGTMKKFPYKKIESHLNSGDRILLYSDGLPELANDKGQMFGYDKIKTEYYSIGEKEPEEIVDHLKNSASQWANGKEPDDDVTFVVIKIK